MGGSAAKVRISEKNTEVIRLNQSFKEKHGWDNNVIQNLSDNTPLG